MRNTLYAFFIFLLHNVPAFQGDILEILVIGGALLGIGIGLIIRSSERMKLRPGYRLL